MSLLHGSHHHTLGAPVVDRGFEELREVLRDSLDAIVAAWVGDRARALKAHQRIGREVRYGDKRDGECCRGIETRGTDSRPQRFNGWVDFVGRE